MADGTGTDWVAAFNEAAGHFNAGRHGEAERLFRVAAEAQPNHATVQFYHGLALRMTGRPADAVERLAAALRLKPDLHDALVHLAGALVEARRGQEAFEAYRRLLAVRPDHADAAVSLGNLLMASDLPEVAEQAYRRAVTIDPAMATAVNNLGASVMSQNRLDDAAVLYRRGVRLQPDSPEYNKNLGTCRMMAGDFEEGGRGYEWRELQPVWKWRRSFPGKPRWDGGPLDGRTILVHFEQGIGDTFQFMRYGMALQARGARVVFECQAALKRFLTGAPGIDALVGHGEPLPDFDVYAPLMSLPYLCRSTPETVPGGVPYLRADPVLQARWAERMGRTADAAGQPFRIGINWHANEVNRSIPLELFVPMSRLPGVELYSLQKVVGMDQLDRLKGRLAITDWTAEMDTGPDGFVDTAAVMANMDLIISCDTAVNHLAGAMGLDAILVVKWFADWRWMRVPDRSPWYPALRIIRSPRRGDWSAAMAAATEEVARRAAAKAGGTRPEPGEGAAGQ